MTLIPVLATTFKVPKARPPRPETGTGSGGATSLNQTVKSMMR